jgi:MFS family permease
VGDPGAEPAGQAAGSAHPAPGRGGKRAYLVWLTALAVYFLAVFHRSSLGVAGIAATERFGISASELSTFTMLQLLVYAGMQIPVGVLLDRYGPQRLLLTGALVMTAGQFGFALTGSFAGALLARVCVGLGDAMVFISVLRIVAAWFPPMRNPVLTQFTGLIGQCGALVAAIPLARALSTFGWTTTFLVSASVGLVLGLLVALIVRDVPPGAPPIRQRKDVRTVGRDLWLSWRDPGTRLGLWTHFTAQFGANVLGLLWGYPFFLHGEHTGRVAAGSLLSLLVVTMMVGGPIVGGYIARNPWHRSTIVLGIVGGIVGRWAVVLLWPGDAPVWMLAVMVIATGLGGPGSMVGFDLARTFAPPSRLGSATGIVNIGGFVASLTVILAVGVLLDVFTPGASTDYDAGAYKAAMAVQFVPWLLGGTMIYRYRRRARAHLATSQPETYRWMRRLD